MSVSMGISANISIRSSVNVRIGTIFSIGIRTGSISMSLLTV